MPIYTTDGGDVAPLDGANRVADVFGYLPLSRPPFYTHSRMGAGGVMGCLVV